MAMTALIDKDQLTPAARKSMYLSHFTPSMMPVETLEQLLVKRATLVDRIVKSAVESVKTKGLHHHLFVGPRGIGKTHLISLLFHRLSAHKTIQSKGKLVWMREEEWGVTSFFELVLRILRNLDLSEPSFGLKAQMEELYELKPSQAEAAASHMLLQVVKDKTLVILLENLDDLFEQMGDSGQQKWRAFIQNNPQFVMIATTPALFKGVTSQKAAFYGSFDVEALDELSFDEVVELLEKIAEFRGDQELVDYIKTPEGRARIRAVHHLAEGNPRIYIIFAQFLSKVALDELVQAFMHTLDELTPYYQARMKERSGQQRKILDFLVKYRGAAPVKDIAKACFISQQVCSVQLKVLKEARFVRAEENGRMSYYELREPLMRLCMEVKQQRGEPLSLFVDILRIWYLPNELKIKLLEDSSSQKNLKRYFEAAVSKNDLLNDDPKLKAIIKDLDKAAKSKTFKELWLLFEEIFALYPEEFSDPYPDILTMHIALFNLDKHADQRISKLGAMVLAGVTAEDIQSLEIQEDSITSWTMVFFVVSEKLFRVDQNSFFLHKKSLERFLIQNSRNASIALFWAFIEMPSDQRFFSWLEAFFTRKDSNLNEIAKIMSDVQVALASGNQTMYLRLPKEIRRLLTDSKIDQFLAITKEMRGNS